MELFHTSPESISKINRSGLFDSFLCFSSDVYVMTAGDYVVYGIDQDESQIIEAGSMFYQEGSYETLLPIVMKVMKRFGVTEEEAIELLDETSSVYDIEGLAERHEISSEDLWWRQLQTAICAKMLGYQGCLMTDEQGGVYFIDMFGRESELQIH